MSRESRQWILLSVVLAGTFLLLSRVPLRAEAPREVNFQARLTDTTGKPLPDGVVDKITFRIFADEALTQFLWGEQHSSVPVSRGIVSVRLGRGSARVNADGSTAQGANPLDLTTFNGSTRYVQVQVGAQPPLSPPIALVSVPYAISAGSLNGKTEDQISAPVGAIVDWYRPDFTTQPPSSWRVCDGSTVNDVDSPFNGKAVPNLVNMFTRGLGPDALSGTSYGGGAYPRGGNDQASLNLSHTHGLANHTHKIEAVPDHVHPANLGDANGHVTSAPVQTHSSPSFYVVLENGPGPNCSHSFPVNVAPAGGHDHGGMTGPSSAATDPALVNSIPVATVPAYVGLVKIIRIK